MCWWKSVLYVVVRLSFSWCCSTAISKLSEYKPMGGGFRPYRLSPSSVSRVKQISWFSGKQGTGSSFYLIFRKGACTNTPLEICLSGLLLGIISIRLDLELSCGFGRVGSEINCQIHTITNIFEFIWYTVDDNQSRLKSPRITISEVKREDSSSVNFSKASAGAEGCLQTPTTGMVLFRAIWNFRAIKSKNLGSQILFQTETENLDLT